MDCMIGGFGVALFFLILRELRATQAAAAVWSCVLALSLGYWMWSTDAQNYIFDTLLLTVNFFFLVRELNGRKLRPAALGALHALGVMGHIVNGVLGIVYIWHLRRTYGKAWLRPFFEYLAAAAAGVLGAYALVLFAFVHPGSPHGALLWFWGASRKAAGDCAGTGASTSSR
jgi:hypothetical protein